MSPSIHETWKNTELCYHKGEKEKHKQIEEIESDILKGVHVYAMKVYGNTIVSKQFTPEQIIDEFRRFKLLVTIRPFDTSFKNPEEDTHYVVELLPDGWLD